MVSSELQEIYRLASQDNNTEQFSTINKKLFVTQTNRKLIIYAVLI